MKPLGDITEIDSQALSKTRVMIDYLLYSIKDDVSEKVDKLERKQSHGFPLPEYEQNFLKAWYWCSDMHHETFANDFTSVMMYLNAGFSILPKRKLYYDEMSSSYAYVYLNKPEPEYCDIFNVKLRDKAYLEYKYAKPFDNEFYCQYSILHELGHLICRWIDSSSATRTQPKDYMEKAEWAHISEYASSIYCEYCAEAITYLFMNANTLPREYLRFLPLVSDNSHHAFAKPYQRLFDFGYTSMYDKMDNLLTPYKMMANPDCYKEYEKHVAISHFANIIDWCIKNYYTDYQACLGIQLICLYINEVYDRMPYNDINKLSILL